MPPPFVVPEPRGVARFPGALAVGPGAEGELSGARVGVVDVGRSEVLGRCKCWALRFPVANR